jgi:hypothetical protein
LFRLGESFVVKVTRCALLITIPPTMIDIFLWSGCHDGIVIFCEHATCSGAVAIAIPRIVLWLALP